VQGGQFLRLLDGLDEDVFSREGGGLVLLLPLLAEEEKGALPAVETGVLQGLLDELGLAGIQEPGEQVNRDLFHHRRVSLLVSPGRTGGPGRAPSAQSR